MWFLDQMVPDSTLYNTQALWRIDGDLDVSALEWAVTEVVRRHSVLRSRITTTQSGPLQVIDAAAAVRLPLTDLSGHPRAEAMDRVHELSSEEATRPFDLAAGPLLRPRLFRIAADSHCLLASFHHSVIDAWSLTVLWRELSSLYDARRGGRPSSLAALPFQYSDYAAHQHAWLGTEEAAEQLAYWQGVLKDAPDVIDLPTDRPRPATPSGTGGRVAFRVPAEVEAELRALARSHDATLFMVLLAAYGFLLSVYARRSDVVVGVPAAGRTQPELEDMVGLFINSLPVRLAWEGCPTAGELLRLTKEASLDGLRHQDVPFERLVDALTDERQAGVNPLFQTWFDFDQSLAVDSPSGLHVERVPVALHSTRFDLEMLLEEGPDGLTGSLGYNADLFDPVSGERFVEHYLALLAAFAHRTDAPLAVPAAPAMSVLDDAGTPAVDAFTDVLGEFEAWVDRAPQTVALVSDGHEMTYGELDARANQLAHFLRSRGVGPESVVGVCGTTGFTSVIALLGILKADGAYLPLDTRNPHERLQHMVRTSRAHLVLTERTTPHDPAPFGPLTHYWDEHRTAIDGQPTSRPRRTAHPDTLMYIVYTSGSTGTPKGIAVPRRTIGNLVAWKVGTGMRGQTCVQLSSVGFDVFLQETFTTFASGGQLVLADDRDREDPGRLLELMARHGVERLYLSPSLLQQLAATSAVTGCVPPLREVVAGGEVLRLTADVRAFLESLDNVLLENQYGPSETHHATSHQLTG
ncbi:condensation domain-containing protein, partial [Streptomyces sp. NPDC006314]|uniref:non-ribosomal peptide synthetase n=1 Tax=Streptomyces sp. NPDC006314 TaxID=3154475 RepID=UPI0033BB54C5